MLFSRLLHPEILSVLARSGHGSRVLIADGNYPVATHASASATKVFLNLCPGLVRVADVLEVLRDTIPIDQAAFMATPDGQPPAIQVALGKLLPSGTPTLSLPRAEFYSTVGQPQTALVIATGEQERFANIIITIGVVKKTQS